MWGHFAAHAALRPTQAAVIDGGTTTSYAQLLERAEAIASALAGQGVAAGSLVGVCLPRSGDVMAAMLGVLRAGCGYVPLDPDYPTERVRFMVRHSGMVAAIVGDDQAGELCADAPSLLRLSEVGMTSAAPSPLPEPGDIAYVIYTSGSSGDPKGVLVEHRSVAAMARSMRHLLDDEELSGVLAAASICFDPSVMEILGTLMLGGTVVLAKNALALRDLPAAHRVRTAIMVPSAMKALLAAGDLPPGVRCVVLGGEVLTPSLVDALRSATHPPRIINVYGPTEATVFATASEISDEAITIGSPIPTCRAYVLDEDLQATSTGDAGELFLAGDQLARGYHQDEQRTRQHFVEVPPGSGIPEERLYRTGDRCRWTPSGQLAFLGRADRQVKLRGYRIELDEIERALESLPGISDLAVAVRQRNHKKLLVAYVVGEEHHASPPVVREHLAERLPSFMVPQVVLVISEIPRLPNGKVDEQRLPSPSAPTGEADRTALHGVVRSEIAALIGAANPSTILAEQSLSELGLDSLDLAELTVRISETLGTNLPSSTLTERMTLGEATDALLNLPRHERGGQASVREAGPGSTGADLAVFQTQVRTGHPPSFAAKIAAWSASDRGALVHQLSAVLSRSGLDPYGKVVRTGSAERGVVADVRTGEERASIIWTTNLYLGLNRDPDVIDEARAALSRFGTGMGISAAGSGQTDLHLDFEREFASMVGKESACLFPTGFTASVGAIAGTLGEQDVVVMDQLCHASLVDGARLSGAKMRTFRHNDVTDLRRVLGAESSPHRTTMVVLESVYSMGEGTAPLRDIVRTAKEYGALVLVDEAHSFGLYGDRGAGLWAAEGVTDDVDLIVTTLSKALGSIGGVVAARQEHVALLKTSARTYVFQANVSPVDIAAALAALRRVGPGDDLRERLWDTARYMRERFASAGYDVGDGDGLIVTPHFPDGDVLRAISKGLFTRGVHTAAVTYPIVERGRGRLRFICSASHTRADVDETLAALVAAEAEASAPTAPNDQVRSADPAGDTLRATVDDWADSFTAYLERENIAGPALEICIEIPGAESPVKITLAGHSGSADHSPKSGTPRCSLRLMDAEAGAALCSGDVQRLLRCVLEGTCALGGDAQPFVWLIGRLNDQQRASADR